MRQGRIIVGGMVMAVLAILSGCETSGNGGMAQPPRAKPARISVTLEGPTEDTSILAGVSTGSGELMILENDGSVTKTAIDSARGRQTLRQGDADMFNLTDVLIEDESIPLEALPKPPRAQDLAIEEFAARRRSALPVRIVPASEEMFLASQVRPYARGRKEARTDLVSVLVNLKPGVDATTALAYATCSLAAWATTTDTPYARHIRTLSGGSEEVVAFEAIYIMSKTMPLGLQVMEREQTLRDCGENGIPAQIMVGPVEGTKKNG